MVGSDDSFDSNLQNPTAQSSKSTKSTPNTFYSIFNKKNEKKIEMGAQSIPNDTNSCPPNIAIYHCIGNNSSPSSRIASPISSTSIFVDMTPNGKHPLHAEIADEEPNPETCSPNPQIFIRNRLNLLASRNLLNHFIHSGENNYFGKQLSSDITANIPDLQYNETAVQDMVINKLTMSTQMLPETIEEARKRDPEFVSKALEQTLEGDETKKSIQYWSQVELEILVNELSTDLVNGLSEETARELMEKKYGPNKLQKEKHEPLWKIFLSQFTSLVVSLLLIAGIVSLAFQEWVEGIGILFIVLINASLATYMENSASNALAKLADLSSPKCTIVRCGVINVIPAHNLVPGDIVLLRTGDNVPADVRLIEATEIKCNEALLTGESEDVSKHLKNSDPQSPFPTNLCFASTAITNGTGRAVVVLTGMNTQIGRIAQQLKLANSTSNNGTPLQIGLNRLGGFIGFMSLFVLVIIVIVALLTNYKDPSHPNTNPVFSIILVAVGFAVSSIPEGLPMVVTICLSIGCSEMCRRKANIRKLPAVETLGCCSVICSDKTGTLTEGKMTAVKLATFSRRRNGIQSNLGPFSDNENLSLKNNQQDNNTCIFSFYPTRGSDPNGGIFLTSSLTQNIKEELLNLVAYNKNRTMELIENSNFEKIDDVFSNENLSFKYVNYNSVCIDYGDPLNTNLPSTKCVRSTLLAGYLNSYGTVLVYENESKSWKTRGNMSEGALIVAAAKASFGLNKKSKEAQKQNQNLKNDELMQENNFFQKSTFETSNKSNISFNNKVFQNEVTTTGSSPDSGVNYESLSIEHKKFVSKVINCTLEKNTDIDVHNEVNYQRIPSAEVPFTSSRKMMMTVHSLPIPNQFGDIVFCKNDKNINKMQNLTNKGLNNFCRYTKTIENLDSGTYTHVAIIKGAPDRIVRHVGYMLDTTWRDEKSVVQIDNSERINSQEIAEIENTNKLLSSEALRVLGIAILPLTSEDFLDLITEECSDKRLQLVLQRNELTLLGLVGFLDPPRPGVEKAITKCCEAGVRVIMITGDQQPTACAIARSIGLLADESDSDIRGNITATRNGISGSIVCNQLHENGDTSKPHLSNEEFDNIVSSVSVFCRAQPEDKIAIVRSLQRQGEVVAMTGDGVNDAPALKAADIGVAMGISGTEVAKGASEMVLLDDNFVTIVNAIEEGRKIYSNVQKFVAFLLGTNIGEIIYLSVAIAAQLPIPIAALQILFLNLMSDGSPAVALSVDPPDPEMMKVPPRPKKSPIMTRDWWLFGNIPHAIFEAICVLAVLIISMYTSLGVFRRNSIESLCLHDSESRYFCQTHEWRLNLSDINKTGWVTNIDFYNPLTNSMEQILGVSSGMTHSLLSPIDIPYVKEIYEKAEILGISCFSGKNGWCIPQNKVINDDYIDLVAFGTIRGRTASFIAAVFCEMLRAYTVRTWDWFTIPLFNNPWLHFACSLSASSTLIVTFTPGLQQIFGTYTIYWWLYILAIGAGFLNMAFDELVPKPLYRKIVNRRRRRAKLLAEKNVQETNFNSEQYPNIFSAI